MSESTITVIGNVATPPMKKMTSAGEVATFRLASSRSARTDNGWESQTPTYFDVEVWGQMADNLVRTAVKGVGLIVQGYLRTETWVTEEGDNRYRMKLVAKFLGPHLKWQSAKVMKSRDEEFVPTPAEVKDFPDSVESDLAKQTEAQDMGGDNSDAHHDMAHAGGEPPF
ncbi:MULTISPECIES: single-stranded DNA-binding protein [unclassified Corynebacterium]|uniref:single-stranded DNA-binding protein n=1 Tax=unclassified Corynebacterium TaxID=2624378 RepID=UPI00309CB355